MLRDQTTVCHCILDCVFSIEWDKVVLVFTEFTTQCVLSRFSCVWLCDPMDYTLTGSSVCGILQARTLEWVALPSSRGSSPPRDWTHISYISVLAGRFFTTNVVGNTELICKCPIKTNREGDGTPLQYSCLENPMDGGAWWGAVHGVAKSGIWLSNFTFTFLFHALEKEMATHSSILAWRIPGTGEAGGLPSMGSHRVGHDWSDLTAIKTNDNLVNKLQGDTTVYNRVTQLSFRV